MTDVKLYRSPLNRPRRPSFRPDSRIVHNRNCPPVVTSHPSETVVSRTRSATTLPTLSSHGPHRPSPPHPDLDQLHAPRPNPDNTAKLSSPILLQRTVSYDAATKAPRRGSIYANMADKNSGGRRRRSSSILQVYHEPPETLEQINDQASLPNLNANWTNAKGELPCLEAVPLL
jgi:hypothetical protein